MAEWILALLVLLYVLYCLRMRFVKGNCSSKTDLSGKTVIVTGCDKGIGYFTALDLARRNARVIMACRNLETANSAATVIKQQTGNQNIDVRKLDLSSLASVRKFAEDVLDTESRLDILINNAGIPGSSQGQLQRTEEGFEITFVTNYLGHFLLTMLLLDLLRKSAPSRIVNVSSLGHKWIGSFDLENLNAEKFYTAKHRYFDSKLEQIFFTRYLAKKLEGTGVTVNALHPGSVQSELFQKLPLLYRIGMTVLSKLFFRSAEEGAQTSIYVAVSSEVEGMTGKYFSDCHLEKPSEFAMNDEAAQKIFELSLKYCQISDNL